MTRRRSTLVLMVVTALVAGPLALGLGGCLGVSPACEAICSAGRVALVSTADVAIGRGPTAHALERPLLRPPAVVLAVPSPPPEPASPFV